MSVGVESAQTQVEPGQVGYETKVGPCEGETDKSSVKEVHGEGDTSHKDECRVCEESF